MKKQHLFLLLAFACLWSACSKSIYNPKSPNYEPIVEMTTEYGVVEIQLYSSTPKHRDNFVKLVKEGFYDSLLFHRVINNFMIQGGDPESKGAAAGVMLGNGGPGYTIPAEFVDSLVHIKGALAAARMGDGVNPTKASSGSQFYLVQGQKVKPEILTQMAAHSGKKYTEAQKKAYAEIGGTPHLDGSYTVFGRVIKGLDVIDKIAAVQVRNSRPVKDVMMTMKIKKG
ncbi:MULTISPECIES: peptidylprolyl isomerase [unclassified Aureispira]|uniref:peptidylprolyl isomerase n=1 Tax=unclassified Aureispira TaxID=2649989 RepID=UPI000696FF52|nr:MULTISPECIES: peptidylprolyl isomerase [unclassified Aureispira]WMX13816.1 peptidylprolyl isomerase [Aureispira sp. CCB-E]